MRLEKKSPCKVNLLLNILGKRADGFHELETVMQPVNLCDEMTFERAGAGLQLTCSHPELPTDSKNLVHRAATAFLAAAKISDGVKIHLQKNLPLAGGIGGGSANAAVTFTALNELFGSPLPLEKLHELAAALGSDVPFFLYDQPALATGRGEKVQPLENFPALRGKAFFLVASRLRHFHAVVVSKSRAVSRSVERPGRPRAGIDFRTASRRFARRRWRLLQFARSAGVRQISGAAALPGISAGERRAGFAHVRQRLDDVCHRGKSGGGGKSGGEIQIAVRRQRLDGDGGDLMVGRRQRRDCSRPTDFLNFASANSSISFAAGILNVSARIQ